ncbi:MAG: hypothetical protein H7287_05070 [Thermoleophilia bacterium]|nr:hypothetical protein [Thermoleophilia bacterium]
MSDLNGLGAAVVRYTQRAVELVPNIAKRSDEAVQMRARFLADDGRALLVGRKLDIQPSEIMHGDALVTRSLVSHVTGVPVGNLNFSGKVNWQRFRGAEEGAEQWAPASAVADALDGVVGIDSHVIATLRNFDRADGFVPLPVAAAKYLPQLRGPEDVGAWVKQNMHDAPYLKDPLSPDLIRVVGVDTLQQSDNVVSRLQGAGRDLQHGVEGATRKVGQLVERGKARITTVADHTLGLDDNRFVRLYQDLDIRDSGILDSSRGALGGLPKNYRIVPDGTPVNAKSAFYDITQSDFDRYTSPTAWRQRIVDHQMAVAFDEVALARGLRLDTRPSVIPTFQPRTGSEAASLERMIAEGTAPPPTVDSSKRTKRMAIAAGTVGAVGVAGLGVALAQPRH